MHIRVCSSSTSGDITHATVAVRPKPFEGGPSRFVFPLAEAERLRGYDAVHLAAAIEIGADVVASSDHDLLRAADRARIHTADPTDG